MTQASTSKPTRSARSKRTMVTTAIGLAVIAVALILLGLLGSGSNKTTTQNARNSAAVFNAGSTHTLLEQIHQFGPILFPDLLHGQHGIVLLLQHQGDNSGSGWIAINARPPGATKAACLLKWEETAKQFIDQCSHNSYPANGAGLTRYKTNVTNDVVQVNINKVIK